MRIYPLSFKRSDDLDSFLHTSSGVLDWGGCKWLSDKLLINVTLVSFMVTIVTLWCVDHVVAISIEVYAAKL